MEIEETVQNEVATAEEKEDPDYTTVDEYLEYMNKGGTYAGQIEIYAVLNYYKEIFVFLHLKIQKIIMKL